MQHQPYEAVYKGKLKVAIKFEPDTKLKGRLIVSVKEAKELPQMDPSGLTDSFVKTYLLPKRCSFSKQKTKLIKGTLNPTWNEDLEYKLVTLDDLRTNRVLELTVWDYDRRGCNDFIGSLRLGPNPASACAGSSKAKKDWMYSTEKEVEQWEEMIASPGQWVEYEHDLKPSIENPTKYSVVAKESHSSTSSTRSKSSLYRQEAINPTSSIPSIKSLQQQATSSMESVDSDEDNKVSECIAVIVKLHKVILYRDIII